MDKKRFYKYFKNKYVITFVLFGLYITLFSQNNLIERYVAIHDLNALKKQKEYYLQVIKENTEKINELITDRENLEKFAREEYMMKKDGEEVFVIVEESE